MTFLRFLLGIVLFIAALSILTCREGREAVPYLLTAGVCLVGLVAV